MPSLLMTIFFRKNSDNNNLQLLSKWLKGSGVLVVGSKVYVRRRAEERRRWSWTQWTWQELFRTTVKCKCDN